MKGLDTLAGMAGYEYERTERERKEKIEQQEISSRFSSMATLAHRVGKENSLNPFDLFDNFLYHSYNAVTLRVGSADPSHGVVIRLAETGQGKGEMDLGYYVYDGSHFGYPVKDLGLAVYLTQKRDNSVPIS